MDVARARALFPVTSQYAYCNNAAVSPIATPVRTAMLARLTERHQQGAMELAGWFEEMEGVRGTLAALVGATPEDIALMPSTSAGLGAVAEGLPWRDGDRIVTFDCEFPANIYPWLHLRRRGVRVELLPESCLGDLERLRSACRGARLLSLSFVQYLSGFRADLAAIGEVCREAGAWFVVDGIQGLGAFPLDVRAGNIHALANGGYKWLTGPLGAGFLYVAPALLEAIEPQAAGWVSVAEFEDYGAAQRAAVSPASLNWRAGAARLEAGSCNLLGYVGLGAAIELLRSFDSAAISAHILQTSDLLRRGLCGTGCTILQKSDVLVDRSGITSFQHPRLGAAELVERFRQRGVICAERGGWVRCAHHLYNSSDDIERLLAALP
ncbi:MAG: aminotransferase class V-fold PLP-dependent enzyme [Terriglobales bacterium]